MRKKSLTKLKDSIRAKTKRTRGDTLARIVADLNSLLRGWFAYFKHAHKDTFEKARRVIMARDEELATLARQDDAARPTQPTAEFGVAANLRSRRRGKERSQSVQHRAKPLLALLRKPPILADIDTAPLLKKRCRYLEVGSVVRLKTALDAENIRSPVRMSGTGKRALSE